MSSLPCLVHQRLKFPAGVKEIVVTFSYDDQYFLQSKNKSPFVLIHLREAHSMALGVTAGNLVKQLTVGSPCEVICCSSFQLVDDVRSGIAVVVALVDVWFSCLNLVRVEV